jgi:hypothetical protein
MAMYEFVVIFLLLVHILVVLRYTPDKQVRDEHFMNQQITEEEFAEDLTPEIVTWTDFAQMPFTIKERVMPQLDKVILGMTEGVEPEGMERPVDMDVQFVQNNSKLFVEDVSNQTEAEELTNRYKDANYALSLLRASPKAGRVLYDKFVAYVNKNSSDKVEVEFE